MDKVVKQDEWYQKLIDDLRLLNFEGIVRTKHAIGKRILEDELKFKRAKYEGKTIENLAKDLDVHASDLWACMKFVKKYPELSHDMRELSWYRIRNYLLTDKPHVSQASGENEWYTPSEYIEAARNIMGTINLDPASSDKANQTVKAKEYFTIEDDGLKQNWHGNVWMNPPYAQPLVDKFSETITSKFESGEITQACILVNNATETDWFQRMLKLASAVCFIRSRVKFIDVNGKATGTPLQGQAIIYFGNNHQKFYSEFNKKGIVLNGPRKDKK